jgi:hypothetical protein
MKTLNWRHTGWSARNFVVSVGRELVGQLTFDNSWNFNAVYTDKETRLVFAQKGFWNLDVSVSRDGQPIGEIRNDFFFGRQTLQLATGETYVLTSNAWGRNLNWKTAEGKPLVYYDQATLGSGGWGTIRLSESLTVDTEKLLVSTGIFGRQLLQRRLARVVLVMIPVIAASQRG